MLWFLTRVVASEKDGEAVYWRSAWDKGDIVSSDMEGSLPGEVLSSEVPEVGVVLPLPERKDDDRVRV